MDGRPWSDLPADVLREISSRVCASADFVYFHAVCKPWRNSRDPPFGRIAQFPPWLLAPAAKESTYLKFRCVFSNACHGYRATPASPVPRRSWVCRADGTAFWYLTVKNLRPTLHDPLTGEVTRLPLFPHGIGQWENEDPCCVVYGDGSTLVYRIFYAYDAGARMVRFKAALLNPGGAEWVVVERTFQGVSYDGNELYAGYHGGKIMVTTEGSLWHVITPDGHNNVVAGDVLVPRPLFTTTKRPWWHAQYNYLLESRGEVLWAIVQVERDHDRSWRVTHKLSLLVHALEEDDSAPTSPKKTKRWVRKDGHSLADRVLFLGWPNSFAMDAARLDDEDGGACAYLAYPGSEDLPSDQVGVYRFNLVSNKAEFMEQLPREWNQGTCTWVIPQPATTPIQELTKRRLIAQNPKQEHTNQTTGATSFTRIERYYGPSFRALVRNLSLAVTTSQLYVFLSKHGKVSSAEVLYYRKTKRSQGIALITMSTIHAHVEDAVEALNALYLYVYKLEVGLVKEERRRLRMSSTEEAQ